MRVANAVRNDHLERRRDGAPFNQIAAAVDPRKYGIDKSSTCHVFVINAFEDFPPILHAHQPCDSDVKPRSQGGRRGAAPTPAPIITTRLAVLCILDSPPLSMHLQRSQYCITSREEARRGRSKASLVRRMPKLRSSWSNAAPVHPKRSLLRVTATAFCSLAQCQKYRS